MLYDVRNHGVVGDGATNNTDAINRLLKSVGDMGGTVYFPSGRYVTGSIFLHSNMTIYLDAGAVLLGSECHEDYPMITQEDAPGYTRGGHCGLISAFGCENIAVHGRGVIDGRGFYWWNKVKSDLKRPRTINPILCTNVSVKDVTIINSPCWTLHPMCCNNVTIEGVTIKNPYDSPNTDGINPESCKNVRISNCHIDVGDDCVTLKSGTEDDLLQKQYACENITISNCTMAHGHGGVVIGSEMSGGVKNVVINNCIFQNTDRGIRLKTRRKRGGIVEDVVISNIVMEHVQAAITMNEYYICGADVNDIEIFDLEKREIDALTPRISNINISNIIGKDILGVGIYMYGLPELPISDVVMNNIDLSVTGSEEGIDAVMAPARERSKGDGIFLENVENLEMNTVHITCQNEKYKILQCKDISCNSIKLA